jgi:hypothetical protein
MTTPDIAGLCERLRKWSPLTRVNPDGPEAADTLERQAAEIKRLRALVKEKHDDHQFRYGDEETPWMIAARAALTGEDT